MGLSVDIRRIARAELVPFEVDEGSYGIGWTLDNGGQGADLIGPKAGAEAVLRDIRAQQQERERGAGIIPFPKDTAAS